jgi:hypothetical protein
VVEQELEIGFRFGKKTNVVGKSSKEEGYNLLLFWRGGINGEAFVLVLEEKIDEGLHNEEEDRAGSGVSLEDANIIRDRLSFEVPSRDFGGNIRVHGHDELLNNRREIIVFQHKKDKTMLD